MRMKKELISYIANGIAVKFGEAVRTMKFQPEGEFGRRQLAKGEPDAPEWNGMGTPPEGPGRDVHDQLTDAAEFWIDSWNEDAGPSVMDDAEAGLADALTAYSGEHGLVEDDPFFDAVIDLAGGANQEMVRDAAGHIEMNRDHQENRPTGGGDGPMSIEEYEAQEGITPGQTARWEENEARRKEEGGDGTMSDEAAEAYGAAQAANEAYGDTWQRKENGEATDEELMAALARAEVLDEHAQSLGAPEITDMDPLTDQGQEAKAAREQGIPIPTEQGEGGGVFPSAEGGGDRSDEPAPGEYDPGTDATGGEDRETKYFDPDGFPVTGDPELDALYKANIESEMEGDQGPEATKQAVEEYKAARDAPAPEPEADPDGGIDEDLSPDVSDDAYDRAAKAVEAEDKGFVDAQRKAEAHDTYGPQTRAEVAAADERLAAAMEASRPFGLDDLDRDERLDRHQELIDAYLEAHDDSPLGSDAGQMIDAIKTEEYLERAALGEEANPASEEDLKAGEELKEMWSGDDYAAAAEASRERKGYSSSEEDRQRTPGEEVSEEAEAAYAAAKEANKAYGETWKRWNDGDATDEETLAALENAEVADQNAQALGAPRVSSMEPMTPGGQAAKTERPDRTGIDDAPGDGGAEDEGGGGRTDRCPDGTHKNKKSGNCEPFRLTGDLQMYIANGIAMRFGQMADKFLRTKK